MEEYTLFEIVDLIMKDIKENAKQNLIQIQMASIPILLLNEEGMKGVQKQSEELMKIMGIDVKSTSGNKSDELEDIKDLLMSFKKGG